MAHKKRKRKAGTHHRRRNRRMSGVHPGLAQAGMMAVGAVGGAIIAVMANQALKTSVTSLPPVAIGTGIALAGLALPLVVPNSPIVLGAAAGMAGMGGVFATNEAGFSLPGISGTPFGVPSARPGYVNRTVGYTNRPGIPRKTIGGNLSGNLQRTVAGIINN